MFFRRSYLLCLMLLLFVNCIFANIQSKDMVLIEKGGYTPLFKYGESLDTVIYVDSFYMSKYPVTNCEFQNFILLNQDWSVEKVKFIFADRNYLSHWDKSCDMSSICDLPVVNVSWFAANAYCAFIGARLPTLDEWEYVASASNDKRCAKDDPSYLHTVLDWYINYKSNALSSIKNMESNYWGIFGLHGYIWEWVSDFNSVILLNTDAEGGGLEEVLYCGATATNAIDPADYVAFMRYAFRNSLEATYTITNLGFRCVKDV